MTGDMRSGVTASIKTVVVGACLGVLGGATGCGGGAATPTERLWVSGVPTSPRESVSAFLTMKSGDHYMGSFFRGSLYRGSHDVFTWRDKGKGRAEVKLLQDDKTVMLTLGTCEPIKGFDYCIIVESKATGRERYYSRKRWVVRRPGKKVSAGRLFDATLLELAEYDEDLAAALEAAAAAEAPETGDPAE
jgi:hypothetical protein